MLQEVEWFLNPVKNRLALTDSNPQPSALATKEYLSAIEQVIIQTGANFREEPPISASIFGPLNELVDLKIDLSYWPYTYPKEKIPFCSTLLVANHDLTAVNQLSVTLFTDTCLPLLSLPA